MRKNIAKVIEAFKAGKACKGDSKRTCWTDGKTIFSYDLAIAGYLPDGKTLWIHERNSTRTTNSQIKAVEIAFVPYTEAQA